MDADDRLQLCNSRYRELLYAGGDLEVEPGTPFEAIVRGAVARGLIHEAGDDPEAYVQRRLAQHRDPGPPVLQQRADGRWVLITERKVADGGTVAVYSDITALKRRELALEEANRRSQAAAAEIGRRHRELEALSSKLAKYLSPQVYASIFAGRQEVKLASQRKKLTVFFSDIAGFTETADKMESEDLTQLLNQYLTEMSQGRARARRHDRQVRRRRDHDLLRRSGDPRRQGGCAGLRADGARDAAADAGARRDLARRRDRAAAALPDRDPHRLLHGRQFRQRGPDGLHDHRGLGEPRLPARARGAARRHPDLLRDLCPGEGRDPLRGDRAHPGPRHRPSGRRPTGWSTGTPARPRGGRGSTTSCPTSSSSSIRHGCRRTSAPRRRWRWSARSHRCRPRRSRRCPARRVRCAGVGRAVSRPGAGDWGR